MASKEDPSNSSFKDHFSCTICLEILNQPVQCQRNEHYFCKLCITKHLEQSKTCPLCLDELTEETLRPPSRVVAEVVSQFNVPRCNNVHRGCKEVVTPEDLPLHHEVCGFAAVVCSNKGCGETVSRQDQSSHENESCKFRKVKCHEVCKEEMVYRDYETHRCFMRKEMNEVKSCLAELKSCLKEIQEQVHSNTQFIKHLQNPKELNEVKSCQTKTTGRLKQMQLEVKKHGDYIRHLQDPLRNVTPSSLIFVAGGHDSTTEKNFEVFNWSTKKWTLYPDVLFYSHHYSCSVVYKNTMMVCGGGENLSRIERVNIKEDPKTPLSFPVSLPNYRHSSVKGVLNGNHLLTFQDSAVHKVVLESPQSVTKLANLGKKRFYGVECVNQNIVIVGGERKHAESLEKSSWEVVDDVLLFDTSKNTTRKLAPLPYKVSKMATVPYQDNVVILGGEDENNNSLSSVVMYNITTQECKRLPSMLEERSGCVAVILTGDVIVVIGGKDYDDDELKSIEYLVLGQDTWNELPPMNYAREGATASVQV